MVQRGKVLGHVFSCVLSAVVIFVSCGLLMPGATHAGERVDVCHIPPDDPENFHTITISENALDAHLDHGDIEGACNAACASLCDDGNACTIDDSGDCAELGCPLKLRQPVNCDDGDSNTVDSCEVSVGCIYAPISICGNGTIEAGESCDDGNQVDGDGCSSLCAIECPCAAELSSLQTELEIAGVDIGLIREGPTTFTVTVAAECEGSGFFDLLYIRPDACATDDLDVDWVTASCEAQGGTSPISSDLTSFNVNLTGEAQRDACIEYFETLFSH